VSATEIVHTTTPAAGPTVKGEKVTRTTQQPAVQGSRLPTTGSPLPIGLLLLAGFALLGAGLVVTVAGEARTAPAGRHRA
jgi:hypothetical protein